MQRRALPTATSESVRRYRVLALSALTGTLTGLAVAGFEWLTREQVFDQLLELSLPVQAAALFVGLGVASLSLRYVADGASPATSEEYIRNFHDRERPLSLRPVLGRLLAGAATLGSGGAVGYEGPSLYMGAAIGTGVQQRRAKLFTRAEAKVLMVAGAAAGVAAIFKAPATGAIFALEVPYRDDTARHLLLPALLGAATGYVAFVAIVGTAPLFSVDGSPPFELQELGGAALLGLVCGLGARLFVQVLAAGKRLASRGNPLVRVVAAASVLTALLAASEHVLDEGLATGSGYRTLAWVTEPGHSLALIVFLLVVRVVATTATVAGGGVGGLFIPLVVAGALTGDAAATTIGDTTNLFPLIGVAAFLGAGYRTPLAGVVFVAEATGRPGFIVPGLIASVASQLVMGDVSVSQHQSQGRRGHLERRFELPIASAIRADVLTVPPDATLREFYEHHLLLTRETSVPVLDGDQYVGMISRHDLREIEPEQWASATVGDAAHRDWPTASPSWRLEEAVRAMEGADVDSLPVLDGEIFIGVVTSADIVRLDEILGTGEPDVS